MAIQQVYAIVDQDFYHLGIGNYTKNIVLLDCVTIISPSRIDCSEKTALEVFFIFIFLFFHIFNTNNKCSI